METVLTVRHLTKRIRGKTLIDDISFEVRAGEIFGFLGPNGSGKTTTIRMLVDLIKPSSGEVLICGHDVRRHPERALRHVGCIVENPEVYGFMTGWENLEYFARMQPGIGRERLKEVAEIVRLDGRIHDKVKTYSLGMRQRLGIAQALLGSPRLLILDEPTNGLDPKGIKELREFVKMLADRGLSLFISSHLLSEIQLMCDRVAIIKGGRVRAVGTVGELLEQSAGYVLWQLDRPEGGIALLKEEPSIRLIGESEGFRPDEGVAGQGTIVTEMPDEAVPSAVSRLVASGIGVREVRRVAPTLEELFLNMTEEEKVVSAP